VAEWGIWAEICLCWGRSSGASAGAGSSCPSCPQAGQGPVSQGWHRSHIGFAGFRVLLNLVVQFAKLWSSTNSSHESDDNQGLSSALGTKWASVDNCFTLLVGSKSAKSGGNGAEVAELCFLYFQITAPIKHKAVWRRVASKEAWNVSPASLRWSPCLGQAPVPSHTADLQQSHHCLSVPMTPNSLLNLSILTSWKGFTRILSHKTFNFKNHLPIMVFIAKK
jgi:hypothetical protein